MRINVKIKNKIIAIEKVNYVKSFNDSKISRKRTSRNESILYNNKINKEYSVSLSESINSSAAIILKNEDENEKKEYRTIDNSMLVKINLKDISNITQNSNFLIKNTIQNSLFNQNDVLASEQLDEFEIEESESSLINKTFLNGSSLSRNNEEKQLGDFYFHKILNAQTNEEIILPGQVIKMKGLLITKPLIIIGQPNCVLEITEGPISINISEIYENEVVKFSQLKINFDISESEKSIIKNFKGDHAKFTVLFRLYPGSLVELEDCDITCNKDSSIPAAKHKLVCFQLLYCKYFGRNLDQIKKNENKQILTNLSVPVSNINNKTINNSPTILTIISTRIEKFYQTIRSAENCIINIEKSYINKNIGKSLCVLNPLILKIVGSVFEGNGDNSIHLKYVKDDNLFHDSRKLFFKNNEFSYNYGTCIYIDGIENFIIDLDITIESNLFKKSKGDGIFMLDLYVKSFVIKENKFIYGKSNGLNLNKVYQRLNSGTQISGQSTANSYTQDLPVIEIIDNEFTENEGFGIFMNDSRAQIHNNNFFQNRGCGLLLISIFNTEGSSKIISNNNININSSSLGQDNNLANSSSNIHIGSCILTKNSFVKNGGSGLRIINYNFFIYVTECFFKENIEFGVHIEIDNTNNNMIGLNAQNLNNINNNKDPNAYILTPEKIKTFKNSDNSKMPKDTNLFLKNCTVVNNMKSGIFYNNCFIFSDNTIISDNLDYAIYIPKEQFQHCFKVSKNSLKNMIVGNIGGPWGEINITNRTLCRGCTSTTKIKKNIAKETPIISNAIVSSHNQISNSNTIKNTHQLAIEAAAESNTQNEKKQNPDNINSKQNNINNNDKCEIY